MFGNSHDDDGRIKNLRPFERVGDLDERLGCSNILPSIKSVSPVRALLQRLGQLFLLPNVKALALKSGVDS